MRFRAPFSRGCFHIMPQARNQEFADEGLNQKLELFCMKIVLIKYHKRGMEAKLPASGRFL